MIRLSKLLPLLVLLLAATPLYYTLTPVHQTRNTQATAYVNFCTNDPQVNHITIYVIQGQKVLETVKDYPVSFFNHCLKWGFLFFGTSKQAWQIEGYYENATLYPLDVVRANVTWK